MGHRGINGDGKKETKRTISPLDKSHPTTTSTPSFFKNSSISFPLSTLAPFSSFVGSRTKGDNVGRAVKETRGFRDWIWGVAAVVLWVISSLSSGRDIESIFQI